MSEKPVKRWRSGIAAGSTQGTDSNRTIGRTFFSLIAIALMAILIALLLPSQAPRNWVVTFAAQPLDELTPVIPFGKEDSTKWILESTATLHRQIVDLEDASQVASELESLKKEKRLSPTSKDTLVVYVVGFGVTDASTGIPQIVVKARSEGQEADGQKSQHVEGKDKRVAVDAMLKSLIGLPFHSILVVFDCSRTLDCPRRGWEQSATFAHGLEKVVKELGGAASRESGTAQKLCVLSASDSRQFGFTLQKDQRSLFGRAWHQSLKDAYVASKRRPKSIDLKTLFEKLRDNIGPTLNEKGAPKLLQGGVGLVDLAHIANHNQAVWFGDVAKIDAVTEEAVAEEANQKKELIADFAKSEDLDGLSDKLVTPSELRDGLHEIWNLWKRCEEIEAGRIQIKDAPRQDLQSLTSPLDYAPHLWRRLKWQIVSDECTLLAKPGAKVTLDRYKSLMQQLETWPKTEPSSTSDSIFEKLNYAWYRYANHKEKHDRPAKNRTKAEKLFAAHAQYANALFVLPELVYLENRLASVMNAKQFVRPEKVEQDDGARLLRKFYSTAFENQDSADLERRVDNLISQGNELEKWRLKSLEEWNGFARNVADELMKSDKNSRSNWVTLELMLTSSIWSQKQRQHFRVAQFFAPQIDKSNDRKPVDARNQSNMASLTLLTSGFGDLKPFPSHSADWPEWYRGLASATNEHAVQSNPNSALVDHADPYAHYLAGLCDPRDVSVFARPYAIWFEVKLQPEAEPEYFSLELISTFAKAPETKKAEANPKNEQVVTTLTDINLDSANESSGKLRFLACWNPSPDRKDADPLKIVLKSTFDANWISADATREVVFDGSETLREDGIRQKLVEWPVFMAKNKLRIKSDESPSALLKIEIDKVNIKAQNQVRESKPKLYVEKAKDAVQSLITVRNNRSVSLSLNQRDYLPTKRPVGDADIFEAPMLAATETSMQWRVTNQSPVEVSVKAELWAIDRSVDWTSPWGRIPAQHVREQKFAPVNKAPLAEYKFESLKAGDIQTIVWNPTSAGDKNQQSIDVTHGLFCRLTVDGETNRESWIELIPRQPRKWLAATATLKSNLVDESLSDFQVHVARQDDNWPWQAYPAELTSKLKASLLLPAGWEGDRNFSEIPGKINVRFKPSPGANDQPIFLAVDSWPRAFRWQVKAFPNAEGKQNSSETFLLNFTHVECKVEDDRATIAANGVKREPRIKRYEIPADLSKNEPILFQLPQKGEEVATSVTVRLEADARDDSFANLDGGCDELRIEQVFADPDQSKVLFKRRADRKWETSCTFIAENPGRLVFKSTISDFENIRLQNLEIREKLVSIRAAFYTGNSAELCLPDGKHELRLLFDGTKPKIEVSGSPEVMSNDELAVAIQVSDAGPDGKVGSGVSDLRVWLRPFSAQFRPLSPEELTKPDVQTKPEIKADGKNGMSLSQIRVPLKRIPSEERLRTYYLVVRARDNVGLESELESQVGELRVPEPKKMAVDSKGKPKDGVIQGRLEYPTGKPASDFSVHISDVTDQGADKTTSSQGVFRFEKLDREVEYTVTVRARSVNGKNYGLQQPIKLKPNAPSNVRDEAIELLDLTPRKK